MNHFTSAIVRHVLETGGLEQNIAKLIAAYRTRIAVMDAALHWHYPDIDYSLPRVVISSRSIFPSGLTPASFYTRRRH